ncbi:MAG: hypothetical protein AB7H86_22110 [Blastocatellales bacterium]
MAKEPPRLHVLAATVLDAGIAMQPHLKSDLMMPEEAKPITPDKFTIA